MVVDYQGDAASNSSISDKEKLYDGSMRCRSDMTESDIRSEIVRLLRQNNKATHILQLINSKDFDFVWCMNKTIKVIDGSAPFDANGLNQVYKNSYIYVRLNSNFFQYVILYVM